MAINGIEIEVGQKWRTRDGRTAEVRHDDGHHDFPLDIVCGEEQWSVGRNGYEFGDIEYPDSRAVDNPDRGDLIELVEHADGFKPWAGGEQPEETHGKLVEVRLTCGGWKQETGPADSFMWNHCGNADIMAYKVVGEVVRSVGEFASAASYSDHMGTSEVTQPAPDPLHVDLIEPPQDALDVQVGGDHYRSLAIQPVEYIHANKIGYFEGNVIKYVTRWRAKNGVADLEKAKHYIDLLIELEGGVK